MGKIKRDGFGKALANISRDVHVGAEKVVNDWFENIGEETICGLMISAAKEGKFSITLSPTCEATDSEPWFDDLPRRNSILYPYVAHVINRFRSWSEAQGLSFAVFISSSKIKLVFAWDDVEGKRRAEENIKKAIVDDCLENWSRL